MCLHLPEATLQSAIHDVILKNTRWRKHRYDRYKTKYKISND